MSARLLLEKIKNSTTGLDAYFNAEQPIEVVECLKQTLAFVADKFAAEGQKILLAGKMEIGNKTWPFEATGQITGVNNTEKKKFRFEVHLNQFDKTQWKRFLTALAENQSRADRIFTSIRSEE